MYPYCHVLSHYFQVGKAWLRDLPEDLDMFIAQRDFERAMELIDRSEFVVISNQCHTGTLQYLQSTV